MRTCLGAKLNSLLLLFALVQGFKIRGWSDSGRSIQLQRLLRCAAQKGKGKSGGRHRKSFENNGGVLYARSFLSHDEFENVLNECRKLRNRVKIELGSVATGRLGGRLGPNSKSHGCLMTHETGRRLAEMIGLEHDLVPAELPIELRTYPKGSGMEWHKDDVLSNPPQIEVVFTVENLSDSCTEWVAPCGQRESIHTEPNSILLIKAGDQGPMHRVTNVKHGQRTILKLAFVQQDCTRNYADYNDGLEVLHGSTLKRAKNKGKRGKR